MNYSYSLPKVISKDASGMKMTSLTFIRIEEISF